MNERYPRPGHKCGQFRDNWIWSNPVDILIRIIKNMDNLSEMRDIHRCSSGDIDLLHVPRRLVEAVCVDRVLTALAMADGVGTTASVDIYIARNGSAALILEALICKSLGPGAKGAALDGIVRVETEYVGDDRLVEAITKMRYERRNVTVVIQSSPRRKEFGSALVCVRPHDESDISDLALCDRDGRRLRDEIAVNIGLELEAVDSAEELLVWNGTQAGQGVCSGVAANRCRNVIVPPLVSYLQRLNSVHFYKLGS